MKILANSLLLLFFLNVQSFAQAPEWISLMQNPSSNYFKIVNSYTHWEDSMVQKSRGSYFSRMISKEKLEHIAEIKEEGQEHFHHWLLEAEGKYDKQGNPLPAEVIWKQFQRQREDNGLNSTQQIQGTWKCRGPFDSHATFSGVTGAGKGIGRVFPMAVSPVDSNIVFAGTPAGGLWRSLDDGNHWQALTDSIAGIAVRDVKFSTTDAGTCYVLFQGNLFKTIDTGSTWLQVFNSPAYTGTILLDVSQPNTIYLSIAQNGLFKSTDAGLSWNLINTILPQAVKPGNADVLYALNGSNFLRSIDGGLHFDSVATFNPAGYAIAVTPADSNCIYVSYRYSTSYGGVHVSLDGGNTFVTKPSSTNINAYMLYPIIAVSGTNRDVVIIGGEMISRSDDGGSTWNFACTYSYDSTSVLPYVHPDHRCILFNGGTYWDGNDGGLYKSEDGGITFIDKTNGLSVAQFISLSCAQQDTSVFIAGANDCSVLVHQDTGWANTFAGDGVDVSINPFNANNFFGKNQYGYTRTYDGGHTQDYTTLLEGLTESTYGFSAGFPLVFNPLNPNSLYLGVSNVWKSTDRGDTVHAISAFSNSGVGSFLMVGNPDTATLFTRFNRTHDQGLTWLPMNKPVYAVDPDEYNKVWSAQYQINKIKIYFSADTGNTWTEINTIDVPLVTNNIKIECLNNSNDGIFLVTGTSVYYLDNSLSNWQPFYQGLPATTVMAIKAMQQSGIVRVSTLGRGVWESSLFDPFQPLESDFIQDKNHICPGDTIHFYDNSLNAGPGYASVYHWSFPGGNPSQSTLPNPRVSYAVPGTYDVNLVMTANNGSDSIVKTGAVVVDLPPPLQAPFSEDFEGSVFPPTGWNWNHYNPNITFGRSTLYGGYQQTRLSVAYNSWTNDGAYEDYFITPDIDLSLVPDPVLRFDLLYAYDYNPTQADTLKLFYSYDCGFTKHYFFVKGGLDLKTDSVYTNYIISFDSSSWTTDTISLYPFAQNAPFQIGFEVKSIARCELYVDNVEIFSLPGSGLPFENNKNENFSLSPVPAQNEVKAFWRSSKNEEGFVTVYSLSGQKLFQSKIQTNIPLTIPVSGISKGVYLVQISGEGVNLNKKLVK